jgi:hypothetical protein
MKGVLVVFVIALGLGVAGLWAQQTNAGSAPATSASVPRLVKFSGVLTDLAGKPLSGPVEVTFSVYQNESDAEPLWQETQTVETDAAGRYTVLLGAMSAQGLPMELFTSGEARWLGVAAATCPEQPRVLLVSVPYALEAGDAATLGGKPASAYLLAQPSEGSANTGSQTGGATTAGTTGAQSGARPVAAVATPLTVGGASSGTMSYLAKWVDSSNDLGNSMMFDNGTNVGIGTTAPGTLNGTYFPAVQFQATQAGASSYLTADTSSAGGYAGLLLNRGGANANSRLFAIDNQPVANNTSSRLAFSAYADNGTPTPLLTMLRTGNVGIGTTTPGTLNGTYFASLLLQASQASASTYLTADTELAGGYAGLLLNRGAANANSRLWAIENQPSTGNTSSQLAISTYSDAGAPTALLTILRSGNVGIGTTAPAATLEVNGAAQFDSGVAFGQPVTFASGQTFPGITGGGTVTSVGSGAGLTGGPIYTTGTLSIATGGVTDAMLANAYSGTGSCSSGQVVAALARNGAPTCVAAGGTGTVTSVGSGAGLTGGPIYTTGTLSIATGGVTDAMLANAYSGTGSCSSGQVVAALTRNGAPTCVTAVMAGTDLTGGGTTGTVTLNLDTTKVPTLAASSNVFSGGIAAASFSGDGTSVTNVNAAKLVGLSASAFQPAGSYATLGPNIFIATQTISSGNLALPQTAGSNVGVITMGGVPFAHACCSANAGNAFVGPGAGNFTSAGLNDTATGYQALQSNSSGGANTADGAYALQSNTTGMDNTATGSGALSANTLGSANTATGVGALSANTTGNYNTASGSDALASNQAGNDNTAAGSGALSQNTTGSGNTAAGYGALPANSSGGQNTAVGFNALEENSAGNGNTATGSCALQSTGGSQVNAVSCTDSIGSASTNNTAVGFNAGANNVTGWNNTFVGAFAGPLSTATSVSNATAIGYGATVTSSNALILGGTGSSAVNVGIGTNAPSDALDINNTMGANILVGEHNYVNEFYVDNSGNFYGKSFNPGGADFAESVAVRGKRSQYGPGDLLEIDPSGKRRLALSRTAYSTRAAGIYSTKPGVLATSHTMDDSQLKDEVPLAIVGIVPCKVTALNGPIEVGDLLVSSPLPGHAMKGTDRQRMLGAVVGKALEPLGKGTGVIQVLVTLQ